MGAADRPPRLGAQQIRWFAEGSFGYVAKASSAVGSFSLYCPGRCKASRVRSRGRNGSWRPVLVWRRHR